MLPFFSQLASFHSNKATGVVDVEHKVLGMSGLKIDYSIAEKPEDSNLGSQMPWQGILGKVTANVKKRRKR